MPTYLYCVNVKIFIKRFKILKNPIYFIIYMYFIIQPERSKFIRFIFENHQPANTIFKT